ncbi:MAG: transglycosylase SLT domain-containing protein [Cyanothece sp. SIO1E1]|nr:transglycosylase SLT domain-containing protein [Cyanothece sp. SIO1E1]
MLKPSKRKVFIALTIGLCAMSAGIAIALLDGFGWLNLSRALRQIQSPSNRESASLPSENSLRASNSATPQQREDHLELEDNSESAVKSLVSTPVAERAAPLEAIAKGPKSADRSRARYLLASDLIEQGKAGSAVPLLDNLEKDYPILAAKVILKRAEAHEAAGQKAEAQKIWQALLQQHPGHPVAVEALYALGQQQPQYWDQALAQFPAHPRTVEIAQARLKENPDQLALMRIVAQHGLHLPGITSVLDRMVDQHADQLTPEDWEAIAFGYWEKQNYKQAGVAYSRAPYTPLNGYRAARGLQLGKRRIEAIQRYQRLVENFPDAPETADALLRLAKIVKLELALNYLDIAMERFPDRAAEALLERAEVLEALRSPESAAQARQSVLTQHSQSEAAAKLRWQQAERGAEAQDFRQAWEWARQISIENAESDLAPEATFWAGKWALKIAQQQDAQRAFEFVIANHPDSYYAWRSAVRLGWDVGDFTTVRNMSPEIVKPAKRSLLPAGSEALQELYQLGQDEDAWALWQTEFKDPKLPTVAEQFTDGLMRLGVGDNLDGIFMVSSLAWRDLAPEKAAYKTLEQQPAYWQALYPFPFQKSIEKWSQQRQLNPMLVTALIRQESRFEPKIRSVADAVGLMQVIPSTANWIAGQTDIGDYNLTQPEDNLQMGTWYLDYTHEEYNNNSLFAVASYNAGPGNVADWIARENFTDFDEFVELIPFSETQGYVKSVFGNYWNYLRLYNPKLAQRVAQYSSVQAKVVKALPKDALEESEVQGEKSVPNDQ